MLMPCNLSDLIVVSVSLYDSLDDTGGGDRKKDTEESLDRGNISMLGQVREMCQNIEY